MKQHKNSMTQNELLNTLIGLQPVMQLTAEKLLPTAADAEDTVQEVVIEIWQKRDQLQHVLNLEGYAIQTVKNRCISFLRKHHDIATGDLEQALANLSDDALADECARIEEQASQLDRMMERLPAVQRQAVEMKYIKNMSHSEMQRQLSMSSANVYTTLSRALDNLRKMTNHGR
jgi:RNA polymerase sigma-70 factor (ECF subfamily)